jgi:methionyl-tRNA formyltransferase
VDNDFIFERVTISSGCESKLTFIVGIVPVTKAAEALGLSYHQIPTFTGWKVPEGINLVVAVSFGLFVPPRVLRAAKYGGLNVHPSWLPE